MGNRNLDSVLQHLRQLIRTQEPDDLDEAQLLSRFAADRDQGAFTALLQHHGPMILGLCQRLLHDPHDAEDAFQVTFLVLARKAAQLDRRRPLAPWLYVVAYHVALRIRSQVARRRTHEIQVEDMQAAEPSSDDPWANLRPALDEEIRRLPEKYRVPIVLCYLQGHTNEEAARQIGCPHGTVLSRLSRGRDRLRERLQHRGVAMPATLVRLLPDRTSAVLPADLVASTLDAALLISGGQAATGVVSTEVVQLTDQVVRSFFVAKLKFAAGILLTLCLAGVVGGVMLHHPADNQEEKNPLASHEPIAVAAADPPAPDVVEPRLDRYGDPLPQNVLTRLGTSRWRQGNSVTCVVFSPDDRIVASGSEDGPIRLWNVADGKLLHVLDAHQYGPATMTFSADGKVLVSTGNWSVRQTGKGFAPLGEVRVWDVVQGKQLPNWQKVKTLRAPVAISPDGKVLVATQWTDSGDVSVQLWDMSTATMSGQINLQEKLLEMRTVSFSPDGKELTAVHSKGISVWDAATRALKRSLALPDMKGRTQSAVSADRRVAALCNDDGVRVLDLAGGKTIRQFPRLQGLALSADGSLLASVDKNAVCILETGSGKELHRFAGDWSSLTYWGIPANHLAFSSRGDLLAVGGAEHALRIIRTANGKELSPLEGHVGSIASARFSDDGRSVISIGSDDKLRSWDVAEAKELRHDPGLIPSSSAMVFSPDGKTAASIGGPARKTIRLTDTATGRTVREWNGADLVLDVAFSPDGRFLVSVGNQPEWIAVWDVATGKQVRRFEGPFGVTQVQKVTISPDGRWVATWSYNHEICLWDFATGKEHRAFRKPAYDAHAMRFSPNSQALSVAYRFGEVGLAAVPSGKPLRAFEGPQIRTSTLAFSPDGRTLATAGDRNQPIRLWEVATGKVREQLSGHAGHVAVLSYSADGRRLLSGSTDTTLLVWDLDRRPAGPPAPLTAADREALWNDLRSADAVQASQAIRILVNAADSAVALLQEHVEPSQVVPAERLAQAIADLDSKEFAVRQQAAAALESWRDQAMPALRKVLEGTPPLEVQQRVERLLQKDEEEKRKPPAERVRLLRSLEILEKVNSAAARKLLDRLADGAPNAWLTLEAREVIDRTRR